MELTNLLEFDRPYNTKELQRLLEYFSEAVPCSFRMHSTESSRGWLEGVGNAARLEFNLISPAGGLAQQILFLSKRYDTIAEWSKSERRLLKTLRKTYEKYE
jgi:hypothetical protein